MSVCGCVCVCGWVWVDEKNVVCVLVNQSQYTFHHVF